MCGKLNCGACRLALSTPILTCSIVRACAIAAGPVRSMAFAAAGDMLATVHARQKFAVLWKTPERATKPAPNAAFQRRV